MDMTAKINTDFSSDTDLQRYIIDSAIQKALADIYGLMSENISDAQKYQDIAGKMFCLMEDFQNEYPDEFSFCYPDAKVNMVPLQDISHNFPVRKRRGVLRRLRNMKYKKRLKYLANLPGWESGAYYSDKKKRFVRMYRGSRSKYLKHVGNKAIRRYHKGISSGSNYKKVYDFWWNYC